MFAATFTSIRTFVDSFDGTDSSKSLQAVLDLLNWVKDFLLDLAGIAAVIMVLYSAFLYVTSFGDETKAQTAKKTLIWSIAGLAIVALTLTIEYFLAKTLSVS